MALRRLFHGLQRLDLLKKPAVKQSPQHLVPQTRPFFTTNFLVQQHSPDYYAVLGINRSATPQAVKLAYFKKAKEYHPDTNPSLESQVMFGLIAEAYDVLSDEERRKSYDEFGHDMQYGGTMSEGPGRQKDDMRYDSDELFGKIFGQAQKEGDAAPETFAKAFASSVYGEAAGKEYAVNLTFEEAALGLDFHIDLNLKTVCWKCFGSKSEPGYTWNICPYCEGTGESLFPI